MATENFEQQIKETVNNLKKDNEKKKPRLPKAGPAIEYDPNPYRKWSGESIEGDETNRYEKWFDYVREKKDMAPYEGHFEELQFCINYDKDVFIDDRLIWAAYRLFSKWHLDKYGINVKVSERKIIKVNGNSRVYQKSLFVIDKNKKPLVNVNDYLLDCAKYWKLYCAKAKVNNKMYTTSTYLVSKDQMV